MKTLTTLACSLLITLAEKPESYSYAETIPTPDHAEVKYGDHERNVIDFWKAPSDSPTPVVIVIHGGGFRGGHKEWVDRFLDVPALLKSGISVAAIEYRLIGKTDNTSPPVKACLSDASRAVQFIRSKAKDWNIDKTRVGLTGGSAGGCASLWIGLHDDLINPESGDPVEHESTRVTCVAGHVAQTCLDPAIVKEWMPNMKYGGHIFGKFPLEAYIADREEILPWIKEYSPLSLLTKDDPPVELYYSDTVEKGAEKKDPTHSANFGAIMLEKSEKLGHSCSLKENLKKGERIQLATEFLIKNLL